MTRRPPVTEFRRADDPDDERLVGLGVDTETLDLAISGLEIQLGRIGDALERIAAALDRREAPDE